MLRRQKPLLHDKGALSCLDDLVTNAEHQVFMWSRLTITDKPISVVTTRQRALGWFDLVQSVSDSGCLVVDSCNGVRGMDMFF